MKALSPRVNFHLQTILNTAAIAGETRTKEEWVTHLSEALNTPITTSHIQSACNTIGVKYSTLCPTSGSPVAVLHNRVTALEQRLNKLVTLLNITES